MTPVTLELCAQPEKIAEEEDRCSWIQSDHAQASAQMTQIRRETAAPGSDLPEDTLDQLVERTTGLQPWQINVVKCCTFEPG